MQQADLGKPATGSWCYVSSQCKREGLEVEALRRDVSVKRCHEGEDKTLKNLPLAEVARIAWEQRLDLGLLSEHAYVYKPMLLKNVSPELLEEIKASGNATYIW